MSAPMRTPTLRPDRTRAGEPVFDALARAAADPAVTRRGALRGAFAALGGVLGTGRLRPGLAAPAPREAEAGATAAALGATCGGVAFDSTTQCCAGSTVTPRTAPYKPAYNACGWVKSTPVPDGFADAVFKPACDAHDQCYGTCGSNKQHCDNAFAEGLTTRCAASFLFPQPLQFFLCATISLALYRTMVGPDGTPFYNVGQTESCTCCVAGSACSNTACCGNTCLAPGMECCGTTAFEGKKGECCHGKVQDWFTPCCGAGETPCESACCPAGQSCVGGRCTVPSPKLYCACNKTCYGDIASCLRDCKATLGCFAGICGPASPGQC